MADSNETNPPGFGAGIPPEETSAIPPSQPTPPAAGAGAPSGAAASAVEEAAKTMETKWFSPKNREVAFGKGIGFAKTAMRGLGAVVSVGAIVVGVKNTLRGLGVMSPKVNDEGKEVPAGMGTLFIGIGEVGVGALGLMHSVMRPKGVPAVSV